MLADERRSLILQKLRSSGYIEAAPLASILHTSLATIRRDLDYLNNEGRLTRTRGGAILSTRSTSLELPYDVKRQRHIEQKRRIAAAAAELVCEGETCILDSGSTTLELAHLLVRKRNITIVTNDLQAAVKLASNPGLTLICTGGIARANVYTLLGSQVEQVLGQLRVNKTFLGADAVHPDGTIANVNLEEIAIKRAMVRAGQKVILLADSSKFEITGFAQVCNLDTISVLITDSGLRAETRALLEARPIELRIV